MRGGKLSAKRIEASRILEEVAARYGVTVPRMMMHVSNSQLTAARREYCTLAAAAGVGSVIIGRLLNRNSSTVRYHVQECIRIRKKAYRATYIRKDRKCSTKIRNPDESVSPV